MITISKSDLGRVAVSALGAVAVSATCILGAVGPARAGAPVSVPAWQAQVEHRIARATPDMAAHFAPVPGAEATVAVHFGADGGFAGATLLRSTGYRGLDRRAVRLAETLRYPRLPEAVRGRPQDVTMRLAFGPAIEDRPVRLVSADPAATELASR